MTEKMSKDTTRKGIFALCVCAFVHSYLLISVFPYSGFMAIDLIASVDEENAGTYAGLIASAFMFGRAISSYGWGQVADVYGRTFVLLASLLLSLVFSILFGLSTSFPLALFWRFFL
jgi:MFS family permease